MLAAYTQIPQMAEESEQQAEPLLGEDGVGMNDVFDEDMGEPELARPMSRAGQDDLGKQVPEIQ